MFHPDRHPRSDPESTFDQWLDAFVSGRLGDAASRNDANGPLARAISGARQLHGLAARATPATAARRRIEEDLMRSGALAAPRGTTWIPIEKEARRGPWWSPASPVLATTVAIALIVALSASFIWAQRPAPTPTGAPGFAMASPGAGEPTPVSSLPIVKGDPSDQLRSRLGSYGVIDGNGLTITRPGEDDLTFPGVTAAMPNGVPGEAVLTRDDGTRFVADLTTGETRFDLPDTAESESQAGTYLFVSESGENADWTIWDLRTGDSRPLSEIIDLPADQLVTPVPIGFDDQLTPTVSMQFLTRELESGKTSDIPAFVIAGSLDRTATLDGYPAASQVITSLPVTSPDGAAVAWAAIDPENAIVVADIATGEELARFELGDVPSYALSVGFTSDGEHLVVTYVDRVMLFGWADGEPERQVIAEGTSDAFRNPLFYAPTGALYYRQGESLLRMTIPDADVTTVLDGMTPELPMMFAAPDTPWIFVNLGTGLALIDARTGEVASRLHDMPANPDPSGGMSLASSYDGSTALFQQVGLRSEYTVWVVSSRFPDGLSFTPPINPSMIDPKQTFPVRFMLSPDGRTLIVGTMGDTGFTPRLVGQVAPDPEWFEIDANLSGAYWLPMPGTEGEETDARTLPAQDFATPMASPAASPVAASAPNAVMIIEGTAADARLDNGIAIATLGDDGLTLPVAGGEPVELPEVVQVFAIPGGDGDTLHVIRSDHSEAVIHLVTGDVLFEVPPFQNWTREFGRWRFLPTDDTLTDWTVIDMTTGDTRRLSELVDLPGNTAVMPVPADETRTGTSSVFQLELGRPENTGWVTTDPGARTFVIAGSLDRVSALPDYPTVRQNVGSPTLVASADGGTVAYETRAGDSRVIVLDVASGRVLARFSATEAGGNPTLASFDTDGRLIATDGTRLLALDPAGDVTTVADGFERLDNPLVHAESGSVYIREVDALYRIDIATGEVTEVATGLVPGAFGFTTPGGDWIVFQTRDDHIMVDARTGDVVSRMKPDPTRAGFVLPEGRHPAWSDADGSTWIIALSTAPGQPGAMDAMPAAWILSPDEPDGLEVAGPENTSNFLVSPDGETLYAWTREGQGASGTLWATPLGEAPDWRPVVEDVTPLPVPMMFFPEG